MMLAVNGAMLNVNESGNSGARPVIFVHGFPFSQAMWHHQIPQVAAEFRAIAYDVRGLGESSAGDGPISIEGHVDDLIAILDHLQIHRATLVGLSMGGYIALRALERNPDRFSAAVLCDTRSEADTNEARLNRAKSIGDVMRRGAAAFAEDFLPKLFAPESFQRAPEEISLIRRIIAQTPPRSIAATLLALAARTDTTESLRTISVPAMILVGEQDILTPPDAARALHRNIAGSTLKIIPHAGHMSPMEQPGIVNDALMSFLRGR